MMATESVERRPEGADRPTGGGRPVPRSPLVRAAKLSTLPLGFAGRAVLGAGRRALASSVPEAAAARVRERNAQQLYAVLGELKGGSMKLGQLMSVFEAALPEEAAAGYRGALTRLREAAPALPAAAIHAVLARELGPDWRSGFRAFEDAPAAAASIGQVHRAVWADGRDVAVKIQYPDAREALLGDYAALGRAMRLLALATPGFDAGPMVAELRERVAEELDYRLEAEAQTGFARAYAGDPDVFVPAVVAGTGRVLVSEWVDGAPLSELIDAAEPAVRDHVGLLYVRFLLSGPERAGLLHADPHPGNFRLLPDGRLAVLDFGAVRRLPGGFPTALGTLQRHACEGDLDAALRELRAAGFLRPGVSVDPEGLGAFLAPLAQPAAVPTYRFTRAWLRGEVARAFGPRSTRLLRTLNLPPEYVLIHRVIAAGTAVLCQLQCEIPYRGEALRWLPGFAQGDAPSGPPEDLEHDPGHDPEQDPGH